MRRITKRPFDDALARSAICKDKGWNSHSAAWTSACDQYQRWRANPFKVLPSALLSPIGDDLYDLYDARSGSGIIKKIRDTPLSSCPMCGSPGVGQVDHVIPRETYPEFAIFTDNLVPACMYCNSKAKRTTVKGRQPGERFIHPYYSGLAHRVLWQVRIAPPYGGPTFHAEPVPGLADVTARQVRFHLDKVLEKQFRATMRTLWPDHAAGLLAALAQQGRKRLSKKFVADHTEIQLTFAAVNDKHNSWAAAFYRGLLTDPVAIAWLTANARSLRPL